MNTEIVHPKKGLENVVFGSTAISNVIVEKRKLTYRGYAVSELAQRCTFEETVYLLWHGSLPNQRQLDSFTQAERESRALSPALVDAVGRFPRSSHPMDALRTGVSCLAMEDPEAACNSAESNYGKSISLLAKIPTLVAHAYRARKGLPMVAPDSSLSMAENLFHMCFAEVPASPVVKALDGSLTLYAEHGFNASTFTARVVVSSLSDIYAGIVAAIGSLKGPLHGGANEQVMHMLLDIGSADRATAWLDSALREKRRIMGFGHRLYRYGDSRVPTMTAFRDDLASALGNQRWIEIARVLERLMLERKSIYPNLDFPASPSYYMMGFDIDLFTPIFVIARLAGWAAHVTEQLADNRLVRPLSEYVGSGPREVVPLAHRDSPVGEPTPAQVA